MTDAPLPPERTRYVVFRATKDTDGCEAWTWEAHVSARSADLAIRTALAGPSVEPGSYVAIPQRSFRPVTVRAEQTVTLRIEEARG